MCVCCTMYIVQCTLYNVHEGGRNNSAHIIVKYLFFFLSFTISLNLPLFFLSLSFSLSLFLYLNLSLSFSRTICLFLSFSPYHNICLSKRESNETDRRKNKASERKKRNDNILFTKITATQTEVALSYHRVRGLYFLAVIFVVTNIFFSSFFLSLSLELHCSGLMFII